MFEDPMQWIVIGIVVLALLLWGPNKIPELAASIGKARREFDTARKSLEDPMQALLQTATQSPPTQGAPTAATPAQVESSADALLVQTAKEMGIATEGKTREQISSEIVSRAGQKKQDPEAPKAPDEPSQSSPTQNQ